MDIGRTYRSCVLALSSACAGALLFTACTGSPSAPKSPQRPLPSAQQALAVSSARQVADRLTVGGFACTDWQPIRGSNGSTDMGSCRAGEVVISVYPTAQDAALAASMLSQVSGGLVVVDVVTAANWAINCGDLCGQVAAITGGVRVHVDATTP